VVSRILMMVAIMSPSVIGPRCATVVLSIGIRRCPVRFVLVGCHDQGARADVNRRRPRGSGRALATPAWPRLAFVVQFICMCKKSRYMDPKMRGQP
jgi:hypothetical protein